MDIILITSPIEVITLSDRSDGRLHSSNFEQELEPGTISKSSKSTDLYKRLLLWRSRLQILVNDYVLIFTCILADRCCYKKSSNRVNARQALDGVYRTTRASSFPKFYLACLLAPVGR
jgi:hypothetical protein